MLAMLVGTTWMSYFPPLGRSAPVTDWSVIGVFLRTEAPVLQRRCPPSLAEQMSLLTCPSALQLRQLRATPRAAQENIPRGDWRLNL